MLAPAESGFESRRFRCRRFSDSRIISTFKGEELENVPFFKGRSSAFISALADFFQLATFVEGDDLMREGEIGDKLFYLHRGKVHILVGPDNLNVATLENGVVIGEMALLGSPTRTATVRAAEFCDCRVLDKHTFHRILKKFPEEREGFMAIIRERMEGLEKAKENHEKRKERTAVRSSRRRLPRFAEKAIENITANRRRSLPTTIAPRATTDPALPKFDPTMSARSCSRQGLDGIVNERRSSVPAKIQTAPILSAYSGSESCDEEAFSDDESVTALQQGCMTWQSEPANSSTITGENIAQLSDGRRQSTSSRKNSTALRLGRFSLPAVTPRSAARTSFVGSSLDNLGCPVTMGLKAGAPKLSTPYETRLYELVAGPSSVRDGDIQVESAPCNIHPEV